MMPGLLLKRTEFAAPEAWLLSSGYQERQALKPVARYICEAYSQKKIGDQTWTLLMQSLLAVYIEQALSERVLEKTAEFEQRLANYLARRMLLE